MARLPHIVRKRKKSKIMGNPDTVSHQDIAAMQVDARLDLIRALIPIGLAYVAAELEKEVASLAGVRHSRKADQDAPRRHGTNPGSVKLAGQTIPIRVPRLRADDGEVSLSCYEDLHRGGDLNDHVFRQMLYGISCRNYEQAAEQIPGAIGLSSSTVSRKFVEASAKKLREFQERDLSGLDLVAVFLDGKSFADDQMVIAAGVDLEGHKHLLGFVQTHTENKRSICQFLKSLVGRGLDVGDGLVAVIDGAKGLRSALLDAFPGQVVIQRCQWHKRENVVSYLAKGDQKYWRDRLQKAYQRPTYDEAKRELKKIRQELSNINESAVASLDEGFEETLTLHRLGLFGLLGRSLKTTNIIESINAQAEERCGRVDYWKNSSQKQRWLASALLDIEPRLRRLCGYRHLPALRVAIMKELKIQGEERSEGIAA
jgi:transposase-like protein